MRRTSISAIRGRNSLAPRERKAKRAVRWQSAVVGESPADLNQNSVVAGMLHEYGEVLRQQGAEPFRAAAYDHASDVIEHLDRPLGEVFAVGGREALMALPAVGRSIGTAL